MQDVTSAKLFSDEAASMFERATSSTLKDSMLLYFAYADFEEGRVKYDRVHQIYQRFLELENIDPSLVSHSVSQFQLRIAFSSFDKLWNCQKYKEKNYVENFQLFLIFLSVLQSKLGGFQIS